MSESNASALSNPRAVSRTHKLTVTAMLSTVAFLLMFIEFPIPALIPAFVKLDISDLPELLAAFSLGPIYGVIVTLLKNVLFSVLHGTSSAYVGELFNFIMGRVFSFTAGFIYQRRKSRKSALTGALVGALLMAVLSVPLSLMARIGASETDAEDLSALGPQIEGVDCAITMRELRPDVGKLSLRTGPRINATEAGRLLGGGGHAAAAG